MKRLLCLLAALVILAACTCLNAQPRSEVGYLLGPDDVIEIAVPSHSSFESEKDLNTILTILPDGKINYGGVGLFTAAGKTAPALADEIKTALEKTRDHVVVIVTVKEIHSRRVRIVGAVKAAGGFDLKPEWRLLDLVAVAGGLTVKPTHISGQIVRGADKLITVDMAKAVDQPNSDANVALQPGDLVLLKELDLHNQVSVLGQVAHPGAFDLEDNLTVMTLLSQAGGTTENAALSHAFVTRHDTQVHLNLVPTLLRGQSDPDVIGFRFQPGDVLVVPAITAHYTVLGQVNRPGPFPISETDVPTVLKALGQAGGQTPDSDLGKAELLRVIDGKLVTLPLHIDQMLRRTHQIADVTLQPEDVLYIPSRRRNRGLGWSDLLNPLSVLYYLNRGL
jgi:protein involved in polysaccharide export with SLBB domain